MISRISILLIFTNIFFTLNAQLSKEAFENYRNSSFEDTPSQIEDDAVIIFDRKYIQLIDVNSDQVQVYTTYHRKIKINSLHGLDLYNKLYIPTYDDIQFKTELINCRAKILKELSSPIRVDSSKMVTTTLPANVPFLYKVEGEFKMLALSNLSVGDEIEYLYSIRSTYNANPLYFYDIDRVDFSNTNYCIEKTLFLEGKKYAVYLSPHNFSNGLDKTSDFGYTFERSKGYRVSLTNIKRNSDLLYENDQIDQPYLFYSISHYDIENGKDSWETFARDFKPKRKESKRSNVFNGDSFLETVDEIDTITSKEEKFKYILSKINLPLENNFQLYSGTRNDIDAAFSYAQVISSLLRKKKIAANFHFVVSKKQGELDESNISLYQFDNIIISFLDDDGKEHYFSLLEPYSKLDEIKPEFQNTKGFTISQYEDGSRNHSFDLIPNLNTEDLFLKEINIELSSVTEDKLSYEVTENVHFKGDNWIKVKPYVLNIIKDTSEENKEKRIENFIENFLLHGSLEDTISNIEYTEELNSFQISYQYSFEKRIIKSERIINFKLDAFFYNSFYTPLNQRGERDFPGHVYNSDINYRLKISLKKQFFWIENTLIKTNFDNPIGALETDYKLENNTLDLHFKLDYKKEHFAKEEWNSMIQLRDEACNFFYSKLYFKIAD